MECTIVTYKGKDELMYGRQEMTGVNNPRFYEVSESLIEEIRQCDLLEIQSVIQKIKDQCQEIL